MSTERGTQRQAVQQAIERARGLRRAIADDLMPMTLICQQCGATEQPDAGQVAGFLAHGWPRCCGRQMRVETRREVER